MPFSQANSIEAGTGLGLPLVKRALDALAGTIDVQSDETLGTKIAVVIPMASLTREINTHDMRADSNPHIQHIAPPLSAQLFVPPAWSSGVYGKRGDRLVDNLFSSLSRNLHGLVSAELKVWKPQGPTPGVIFVRRGDIGILRSSCGNALMSVGMIVLGGKAQIARPPVQLTERFGIGSGPAVEIAGPLLPSTLREALEMLLNTSGSQTGLIDQAAALSIEGDDKEAPTDLKDDMGVRVNGAGRSTSTERLTSSGFQGETHQVRPSPSTPSSSVPTESSQDRQQLTSNKPRVLLVDDNAVNLKLLRKFVQKCGIQNLASASGGQEAISLHDKAMCDDCRFDICFMDLSMPDVDGKFFHKSCLAELILT